LFSYVVCNHEDKDASFFVNATPGETGLQTYPQQKLFRMVRCRTEETFQVSGFTSTPHQTGREWQ
jgi:hypothetical protein